jgi:uncharacterized protein YutE (UPF0331/DUF86 family)
MGEKTELQKLINLRNALVDSIMDMSEEEINAELKEDGVDPDKAVVEMRAILSKAIRDLAGKE